MATLAVMLSQEPWNPAVGPVHATNPYLAKHLQSTCKACKGTFNSIWHSLTYGWHLDIRFFCQAILTTLTLAQSILRGPCRVQMAAVGLTVPGLNMLRNRLLGQEAEDFDDFLMGQDLRWVGHSITWPPTPLLEICFAKNGADIAGKRMRCLNGLPSPRNPNVSCKCSVCSVV